MLQFVYLILAGIFASIGQFGITIAYKYAKAKEISTANCDAITADITKILDAASK